MAVVATGENTIANMTIPTILTSSNDIPVNKSWLVKNDDTHKKWYYIHMAQDTYRSTLLCLADCWKICTERIWIPKTKSKKAKTHTQIGLIVKYERIQQYQINFGAGIFTNEELERMI